jgi:hypothetical protein
MKCKFCGCTDQKPCLIPLVAGADGQATIGFDAAIASSVMACDWLIPNVCTAPACVEKAYEEAALLASQLEFFIGRSA